MKAKKILCLVNGFNEVNGNTYEEYIKKYIKRKESLAK